MSRAKEPFVPFLLTSRETRSLCVRVTAAVHGQRTNTSRPFKGHAWGALRYGVLLPGDTTEFAHVVFPDAGSLHTALKALLVLAVRSTDNTMAAPGRAYVAVPHHLVLNQWADPLRRRRSVGAGRVAQARLRVAVRDPVQPGRPVALPRQLPAPRPADAHRGTGMNPTGTADGRRPDHGVGVWVGGRGSCDARLEVTAQPAQPPRSRRAHAVER